MRLWINSWVNDCFLGQEKFCGRDNYICWYFLEGHFQGFVHFQSLLKLSKQVPIVLIQFSSCSDSLSFLKCSPSYYSARSPLPFYLIIIFYDTVIQAHNILPQGKKLFSFSILHHATRSPCILRVYLAPPWRHFPLNICR